MVNLLRCSCVLLLLFVAGCTRTHYEKFRITKHMVPLQHPTLLRTDGVYVTNVSTPYNGVHFKFLRFYENGKCYISNEIKGRPSQENLCAADPARGNFSAFRLRGSDLVYEDYAPCYVYIHLRLDSTSLSEKHFEFNCTLYHNDEQAGTYAYTYTFFPVRFIDLGANAGMVQLLHE